MEKIVGANKYLAYRYMAIQSTLFSMCGGQCSIHDDLRYIIIVTL